MDFGEVTTGVVSNGAEISAVIYFGFAFPAVMGL